MGPKARYAALYAALAGRKGHMFPWHFQWLSIYALERDLRRILPRYKGIVLDVGCGMQPYRAWMSEAERVIGADVVKGRYVDILFDGARLPLPDASVDGMLCTQVMEHVRPDDLPALCGELARVARPGALLVYSLPFMGHEHGAPDDYRRLTGFGAATFLPGFTTETVIREGGIGSTIGTMLLAWWEVASTQSRFLFVVKLVTLPVFLLVSMLVNILGWLWDRLDRTERFYGDVLVVASRSPGGTGEVEAASDNAEVTHESKE
ncbi:MAG TPA: class I SAM-dependent methyltransferase [Ktedonobacterales bacterium]|nr:class I SAM-dependent methyltransferase [Ktedonobacterales bacterium]